jgi:hypothetical protein
MCSGAIIRAIGPIIDIMPGPIIPPDIMSDPIMPACSPGICDAAAGGASVAGLSEWWASSARDGAAEMSSAPIRIIFCRTLIAWFSLWS